MEGDQMTSIEQDREFIASVVSSRLLEDAIDWIADNMDPVEVFGKDVLADWAAENGYVIDKS
jgi:hypothetical protein